VGVEAEKQGKQQLLKHYREKQPMQSKRCFIAYILNNDKITGKHFIALPS